MPVTLENSIKRFRGLSTDEKPGHYPAAVGESTQHPPEGSTFTEIDTGRRFVFFGGEWVVQPQTLEALLAELIDGQQRILETLRATHTGHELHTWEDAVEIEAAG